MRIYLWSHLSGQRCSFYLGSRKGEKKTLLFPELAGSHSLGFNGRPIVCHPRHPLAEGNMGTGNERLTRNELGADGVLCVGWYLFSL